MAFSMMGTLATANQKKAGVATTTILPSLSATGTYEAPSLNTYNSAGVSYVTYIFTGNGTLTISNMPANFPINVLAVGGGGDRGGKLVEVDVLLAELGDHVQVLLADVGQGKLSVGEFRDGDDVTEKGAGEADAAGTDEGDFDGHGKLRVG